VQEYLLKRIGELIAEKEEKTDQIITLFNSKPKEERHLYKHQPSFLFNHRI